ncbi:BglG family transcription antiterminator [Amphibacillus jilinensis]|uniref:BglG family transcription antiterminator n=1 Tax=Amphibacillus jilinensis TaxID=1216008 RepID=UPI000317C567|nr:BglG family transcription antiterminator [Amphibacillus jilinensis]
MQLDARSHNLLKEVLNHPHIKSTALENKYGLSRRQISYSFNKINDWLLTKNLPSIDRNRQGMFIIDPILTKILLDQDEQDAVAELVLTEDTRVNIILLMMISHLDDELSLNHFTQKLDVSKNTILNDIKQAQYQLTKDDLTICYSRKSGYFIEGNEFTIRRVLVHLINKLLKRLRGTNYLKEITNLSDKQLSSMRSRIETIENKLDLKFTDEKMEAMPFSLLITLNRIKHQKTITELPVTYNELKQTKEFKVVETLLDAIDPLSVTERLFFTLQILTTNVYWSDLIKQDIIPCLINAINEMLSIFEKYSCIMIKDREQLVNKLLLHLKPAYYRIKYQLTEIDDFNYAINEEFSELHHLVKKAIYPLTHLLGKDIPEQEIIYLTMLVGGWLTRQGDNLRKKTKAIIVCPKGVSVSKMMDSVLREIFPEFVFLESLSVREFYQFSLDYDIVFSLIPLESNKKVFIVKSFLEKEDRYHLRKQVISSLYGYTNDAINVEALVNLIEKDATIQNKDNLIKRIYSFINQNTYAQTALTEKSVTPDLADFIPSANITLKKKLSSWNEALRLTAKPLIRDGSITENYSQAVIDHCQTDPYIIIGPGIAIPHASPENGVNKVSMSLLRIEDGVTFAEDYQIHIIVLIAALDKQQHFKALTQLLKLSGTPSDLDTIKQAKVKKEITDILKKYKKI